MRWILLVFWLGILGWGSPVMSRSVATPACAPPAHPPLTLVTGAAVYPDYEQRDPIIATYEQKLQKDSPSKPFVLQLLAGEYLKRYRETQNPDDLLRAEQASRQAMRSSNPITRGAPLLLASALVGQHRFHEALRMVQTFRQSSASTGSPSNRETSGKEQVSPGVDPGLDPEITLDVDSTQNIEPVQNLEPAKSIEPAKRGAMALEASVEMELGHYEAAATLLEQLGEIDLATPGTAGAGVAAIQARYWELTGHLSQARALMDQAIESVDRFYTNPAETRSWFHTRAGEMAFMAGDLPQAERRYQEALVIFPGNVQAMTDLARMYNSRHDWDQGLAMAQRATERIPTAEALGYQADAQRALGDESGAKGTEALIAVVDRLSGVKGIYDRAIATYQSEHGIELGRALKIARRERAGRGDVLTEDALAWALAMNGRWSEAQQASARALSYGTEDALMHFHAGVIALHTNHPQEGIRHLQQALALNPYFHPYYADEARRLMEAAAVG